MDVDDIYFYCVRVKEKNSLFVLLNQKSCSQQHSLCTAKYSTDYFNRVGVIYNPSAS